MNAKTVEPLVVVGKKVEPGTRREIPLRISEFYTANPVYVPVVVIHGAEAGPAVFITAAIHGDEINGIEIVRRLIQTLDPGKLRGSVLCVPIVNIFGFYAMSRYLPDGRDLNRAFPGMQKGSPASRIAKILFDDIIQLCDYGIDIHTPRIKRFEIPHTEADLTNRDAHQLARAFGLPVIINTPGVEKSLQQAANSAGIPTIVLSGGEVLRFHETVNRQGLQGILNTLTELQMYDGERIQPEYSIIVREGTPVQTRRGGILHVDVRAGDIAYEGDHLARVTNPFGETEEHITAPETGLLISISKNPLVNPGNEVCSYVKLDKSLHLVEQAVNRQGV